MSEFDRRDIRDWFRREIEEHMNRTGESAVALGRNGADNAKLIKQFLAGASPRIDTVQQLLDYIDDQNI